MNVGDYKNVWDELVHEIHEMKKYSTEHFNNWTETMEFANTALTQDVYGIHGFYHENIFEAVYCTNLLMRSCDVLVTKPSELAFYPVPKLFIKRVGGHENGVPFILQKLGMVLWNVGIFHILCKC